MRRGPLLVAALLAAFACEPDWTGYAAHTCALLEDGAVWCWGFNEHGQLGDGTRHDRPDPAAVGLPAAARSVAAAMDFTCAATVDGAALCWGRNDRGQLGDGTTAPRSTPGPVAGLAGVVRVAATATAACAVTGSGQVFWWGQLGAVRQLTPVPVDGLPAPEVDPAVDAFVTWSDGCALLASGHVHCWNGEGTVQGPWFEAPALSLTGTPEAPCAVLASGAVTCAGALPAPARAVSGRYLHTCAILEGGEPAVHGEVWCWGEEPFGPPVRFGGEAFAPARFATDAASVSVGNGYACAVQTSGAVICWGDGWAGQLGDGMQRERGAPVTVSGLPRAATAVSTSDARVVWDYGCGTSAGPSSPE